MSGIEVAGLVLGAFPIVLECLKCIKQGGARVRLWRDYRHDVGKYIRSLETEKLNLLNTIERLLDGIMQSSEEMEALIEGRPDFLCQMGQYEEALKHRLGRSHQNYLEIMSHMLKALERARKEVGIDEHGKVLWNDYSSLTRELKKLKFTFQRSVYGELLAEIHEANKQLDTFTQGGQYLECAKAKRPSQRQLVDFKSIRHHAKSLYHHIVGRKSWSCRCTKLHVANLRLEPRPWEKDDAKETARGTREMSNLKFRIILSKRLREKDHNVACKWQEIEVEPVEFSGHDSHETPVESQTVKLPVSPHPQLNPAPATKKKSVNFGSLPHKVDPSKNGVIPIKIRSSNSMKPINDICTELHELKDAKQDLGFLFDESLDKHRHNVYFVNGNAQPQGDPKSLDELLKTSRQCSVGFGLSRRDCLLIAVILASSVLQLDGTSWLKNQWGIQDIFFLPQSDPKLGSLGVDCACPYVSWKVSPGLANEESGSRIKVREWIRNEMLLALAVMLTELSLKRSFSEMQIPEDTVDPDDSSIRYAMASRLREDVYSNSGHRYGDVVTKCLNCPFKLRNMRDLCLDNEEFQEAVFAEIFIPLREELKNFDGD